MNFPSHQPQLETSRLVLRRLELSDARSVQALAGEHRVAEMTLLIPHPYLDGLAEKWIEGLHRNWADKTNAAFGITQKSNQRLMGAIGLTIHGQFHQGELGYWLGVPFWSNGYCTEAVRAVVEFGFTDLRLHKIFAQHFHRNPASGRVLQKAGFHHEGLLRQHVIRNDRFEDVDCYGLLKSEWIPMHSS